MATSSWALLIAGISALVTIANLAITWNQRAADLRIEHGREFPRPGSSLHFDYWDITAVGNQPLRDVVVEVISWEAERGGDRRELPVMTDGSSVRLYRDAGAVDIKAKFKRGRIGKTHRRVLLHEDTPLINNAIDDDL